MYYAFTKVTNILRFHEGHSSCSFISVYVSKNVKSHFVCWPAFAKEFVMTSPGEFLILSYCYHATMERTASKDWPQAIHIAQIKNNLYCFYISLINKKKHFPGFIELTWNDQFFLRGRCHQTYMLNFFMKNSCPVLRMQNNMYIIQIGFVSGRIILQTQIQIRIRILFYTVFC